MLTTPSIVRILFMIPVYSLVSFLSYYFYRHAIYFEVIRDCYEAFVIASFFTLLCTYIAGNLHDQKDYFRSVRPRNWIWPLPWIQRCTGGQEKGILKRPTSGLTWFNVRRIGMVLDNIDRTRDADFGADDMDWNLSILFHQSLLHLHLACH